MHVAVLGGGLQGCCIALALADRGVGVVLYDRNPALLSRAAVANEGKIHLGYMYAGDPGLATARMMMRGALAFAPFFGRHLGQADDRLSVSEPATYLVHRDSQHSAEEVSGYLAAVDALVCEAVAGRELAYFGKDLRGGLRTWPAAERESAFDPASIVAAIGTCEVAIDPVALAGLLRRAIAANPRIEVRLARTVQSVAEDGGRLQVTSEGAGGPARDRHDHVVNALWDGRLAVDETMRLRPTRPWLHRLKYGVSFRRPSVVHPPSATVVSGPFGEVVSHPDGSTYLTWYPVCLRGISRDLTPPDWPTQPAEPLRSEILTGTLAALARIVPALARLSADDLADATVKGGVIVAWGATDIDDPASELHRRFEIGVTSVGRFHSVDPGKLTMAPYFAEVCAERIAPVAG
jgi:glycine/D-amino acid oxidase-like deaminating enzyme